MLNIGPRGRNDFDLRATRRGKLSLAHVSGLDEIVSYRGVEVNIPSTAPCVKAMAIKR
jgi:hypothetical protein